ncbi:MAG: hypothetical protein EOP01_05885 [Propionibacteriaceae bacterium]|nr:MAG: hypothetical protein EOP01_05885 [Propionibacteriaceae bacterium]
MAWSTVGNIRGPIGSPGPQGVQGLQGPPGTAGAASINFRGPYSATATYAPGDAVTFGGSSYVAQTPAPAVGTAPTADPNGDDTAVNTGWALLALEGAPGPQGVQGVQGLKGTDGAAGVAGANGVRGSQWYVGSGPPANGAYPNAMAGDQYLDSATGDVYTFA